MGGSVARSVGPQGGDAEPTWATRSTLTQRRCAEARNIILFLENIRYFSKSLQILEMHQVTSGAHSRRRVRPDRSLAALLMSRPTTWPCNPQENSYFLTIAKNSYSPAYRCALERSGRELLAFAGDASHAVWPSVRFDVPTSAAEAGFDTRRRNLA